MSVLVTGGAGFIGSHLVDRLMTDGRRVRVIDNLSAGSLDNLETWHGDPSLEFVEGDLLEPGRVVKAVKGCSEVYHLAANPEVRASRASPRDHFKHNIEATYNLLEAIRASGNVELLVFTSTSTVYGEAETIPTPEDYGALKPISLYGASKLGCEALISAYASMHGFNAAIFRLANVVGPRSSHGVTYDFVQKLRADPDTLEVLGDGSQSKSYLYIEDCIDGIIQGSRTTNGVEIYNIGSQDRVNVLDIAEIVKEEMGLPDAETRLTGGVDGGRGWRGDVKLMHLDTALLRGRGWSPKYSSAEAVRLTARSLLD